MKTARKRKLTPFDVSEYGGSNYVGGCYLDMDTSLADEVSDKIARLCNCGM